MMGRGQGPNVGVTAKGDKRLQANRYRQLGAAKDLERIKQEWIETQQWFTRCAAEQPQGRWRKCWQPCRGFWGGAGLGWRRVGWLGENGGGT